MKKNYLLLSLLTGCLAQGSLYAQEVAQGAQSPAPTAEQATAKGGTALAGPDTIIATINGQGIPLGLFRLFYEQRLRTQKVKKPTPAFQTQVFNEFINIILTAQDAEKKGIDQDPNVQMALELQRLQFISGLDLQDAARTLSPTEEEIQKAYEEHYGQEKQQEYHARHILVKTEQEAKDLIQQLKDGADFQELAKAHSLGPTGKKGGDLGWFDAKQMVPAFGQAVKQLESGHFTEQPVKTQFGWHVILLEGVREAEPPALDSVKGKLSAEIQRKALMDFIVRLRDRAKIELSDLIKATPPAQPEKAAQPKPADTP